MLKPSSVMIRRAALPGSLVAATGAGCTRSFPVLLVGTKGDQGLRISMNENLGCRPLDQDRRGPFGSPEKQRATKLALEASAITSGWNGRSPVLRATARCRNRSVVGDGWPLSRRRRQYPHQMVMSTMAARIRK